MVAFGYEAEGLRQHDVIDVRDHAAGQDHLEREDPGAVRRHAPRLRGHREAHRVLRDPARDRREADGGAAASTGRGIRGEPTYFGFVRRGGDGKDVQWFKGPTRSATHVMGAFDDGKKLYVDVEMSMCNAVPVHADSRRLALGPGQGLEPHHAPVGGPLEEEAVGDYGMEQLYPHVGALPRQDDRYNTMPYRYGFLPCPDPNAKPGTGGACYARFDHQNRTSTLFNAGDGLVARRSAASRRRARTRRRASGYLMGVATRNAEGGRSDLVILDAEHLADGPVATVQLPMRAIGQIHGWWVPEGQLPKRA